MKVLLFVGVLILSGCGGVTPLAQLQEQAFLTGDWSAVEQRERILARRNVRQGMNCPAGTAAYCERRFGQQRCGCVDKEELQAVLSWGR